MERKRPVGCGARHEGRVRHDDPGLRSIVEVAAKLHPFRLAERENRGLSGWRRVMVSAAAEPMDVV